MMARLRSGYQRERRKDRVAGRIRDQIAERLPLANSLKGGRALGAELVTQYLADAH